MVTSEERLKILTMIQEGRITAEEGMRLLETLKSEGPTAGSITESTPKGPRWLHVRVTELTTGKSRVNIRLPVGVINAGMKMGARFSTNLEGMDMHEVMQHIQSGDVGQIVDVTDDEEGEHVEVFLE